MFALPAFLLLAVALLVSGFITPVRAQSNTPATRILFINPAPPEDKHWALTTEVMQAAARDLNVDLTVQNAFYSGQYILKYVTLAAQQPQKPDYIIFRNIDKIAEQVFAITDPAGIKTITIDAPMGGSELKALGGPRQKVKSWIGQFVPNNIAVSKKMAELLVGTALRVNPNGIVEAMAITGPETDIGSQFRLSGFAKTLRDSNRARLIHAFPANWDERTGDRAAYKAFRHAAKAAVWWVANDAMTLGVLNVLRNTHRKVGADTFVGAYNWTEPMMTAILQNKVAYVAGGDFIQGAAALILAYDHSQGRDFIDTGVNHTMEMGFLYRDNVSNIGRIVIAGAWDRVDFRRFSRAANPGLTQYVFDVNTILRAVLGQ